jgi:serine/threonine protein kinase
MQYPNHLTPNTKLSGRYIITRHLGGGGFGQTYLAQDSLLPGNPQCVVKQFRPQLTEPNALQIAKRLFDTEAEVLYKLGIHNQIPRLLAHCEENKEFFLVQEFIEGHDLDKELVSGKKLSELTVISIIMEILEILSFVHKENVIHRDIKPSNIIRRKIDNKLVLIDFGAVKQISVGTSVAQKQTTLTVAIGTPGYMPNEQSNGKPRFCSDVYALGIIGIQALTGLTPDKFKEDPLTGEIVWHNQAQASQKLMEILDRMVCYDFRQRYQSAIEALESFQTQVNSPLAGQRVHRNISPTLQVSPPVRQIHQSSQIDKPLRKLGDVQKILLLGGLIGASIIGDLVMTRNPQTQTSDQQNPRDLSQASLSPSISSSTPIPKVSVTPQISQPTPTLLGEIQPTPEVSPSSISKPSPSTQSLSTSTVSPVKKSISPLSQGWKLMGSASTGESVYVDSNSIKKSGGDIRFTYKIGNELISANADCGNNRWYAKGYGWNSPQSQATQSMVNYVCNF